MKKWRKGLAGIVLLAFCAVLPGCIGEPKANAANQRLDLKSFGTYEELYDYLNGAFAWDKGSDGRVFMESAAVNLSKSSGAMDTVAEDYSKTNVQVEGIDEGDVVKTDGKYIYVLKDNEIVIIEADGAKSREKARIKVAASRENMNEYVCEFYVTNDKLVVVKEHNEYLKDEDETLPYFGKCWIPENMRTVAAVYDLKNTDEVKLLCELGQDGSFVSSRLYDGRLYLLSSYYNYGVKKKEDITSYVPKAYTNGAANALAVRDIAVLPEAESDGYTVIGAIDLQKGKIESLEAVLGGYCTTYMNTDNLYLAYNIYKYQDEEKTVNGKAVREYSDTAVTKIVRVGLKDLQALAAGEIDGYLLNQFALDEYEGYLRAVTTVDTYRYRESEDEKGHYSYETLEDSSSNFLYVLDQDLNVVGGLRDLAEDERVYSVRFDGEVGYFVTFKQVDPLFSVDLSDPKAPKVMGELKIPGFSEYLHVYGEDRLFGLGMSADENTGRTGSLKLSMFDVSDPYNVTEKHRLFLKDSYSAALYNHKAVLVAPEKNLIAFPTERGYEVYGYNDKTGFVKKADVDLEFWSGNCRGVYIGEYFYICNENRFYVCDMENFKIVVDWTFAPSENEGEMHIMNKLIID